MAFRPRTRQRETPRSKLLQWSVLAIGFSSGACIHDLGQDESTLGRLTLECAVPVPTEVRSLGAPVSLEYPNGSLWIWSVLATSEGGLAFGASAFVTDAEEVCESGISLRRDESGAIASLIALTAEELVANAENSGKIRWLAPTGGFVHESVGFLYYEVFEGTDILNSARIGTGLCLLESLDRPCERVFEAGSSVLWIDTERTLNEGAIVGGDRAFIWGGHRVADFLTVHNVSSAPIEEITNPGAYRFSSAFRGWVDQQADAASVSEAPGRLSVQLFDPSEPEGGYLASTLDPFDGRVLVMGAKTATDRFSEPLLAFTAQKNSAEFYQGGASHSGLRQGSTDLLFTYGRNYGGRDELRLARFKFHRDDVARDLGLEDF